MDGMKSEYELEIGREHMRLWRLAFPELRRAAVNRYRLRHPKQVRALKRRHYLRHREQIKKRVREWGIRGCFSRLGVKNTFLEFFQLVESLTGYIKLP